MECVFVALVLQLLVLVESQSNETVNCPPLPFLTLANGRIRPGRTIDAYAFSCDYGYVLIGPNEVTCRKGKWIPDKLPKCLQKENHCDPPKPIPNGVIRGDRTEQGSQIQYICNPGYELIGNGMRTCETYSAWSGITPTCRDEAEDLKAIASKLKKDFIQKVGSFSDSASGGQRSLDSASLKRGLEIVIFIDRSSSIDPEDFKIGINFTKFLLNEFGVKNDETKLGTRAAVLTFGDEATILFNVDNAAVSSSNAANKLLDTLQANGGGTALQLAFVEMSNKVLPLLREKAKKALFLITDGEPNIGNGVSTPEEMAQQLKTNSDFEIFTVGIGRDINRAFLEKLASNPVGNHVFMLDRYSDLQKIMNMIKTLPEEKPVSGPLQCGYISTPPSPLAWPWLAAIYVGFPKNDGPSSLRLCAGVLICKQWVLTAAACFYQVKERQVRFSPQEVFVVMGEYSLMEQDPWQKSYYSISLVTHPTYDPLDELKNNIALIKLNEEVPLNITYRPICLPSAGAMIPLHQVLTTNTSSAGWGQPPTEDLDQRRPHILDRLVIRSMTLAERGTCLRAYHMKPSDSNFCATPEFDGCYESQGSPLIAKDPNTDFYQVIGIQPQNTCRPDFSLYTQIREHVPWIIETTGGCTVPHA